MSYYIFNDADDVRLIDIDINDLIERLNKVKYIVRHKQKGR